VTKQIQPGGMGSLKLALQFRHAHRYPMLRLGTSVSFPLSRHDNPVARGLISKSDYRPTSFILDAIVIPLADTIALDIEAAPKSLADVDGLNANIACIRNDFGCVFFTESSVQFLFSLFSGGSPLPASYHGRQYKDDRDKRDNP